MSVTLSAYSLPDSSLFSSAGDAMLVWRPEETIIVLGQSNNPGRSLNLDHVMADDIPVTKRPTGGEAVVLTPAMAVITAARQFEWMTSSKGFFSEINSLIIEALEDLGVTDLATRGISDITIGNRKILGSSMHRRESRLVYHAVLNLGENPAIFERYLKHPSREPDYRRGRSHSEFVTSLRDEGYDVDFNDLLSSLSNISSKTEAEGEEICLNLF